MTDPPRLFQKPSSGLAGTLLAAGRDETPRDAALRRTLTAVGVGAAVLTSSSVAGGALASGAAGSAVAKGSAGSVGLALALKWIGIGTVGGIVTATAAYELAPSSMPSDSAAQAPAIVASAAPPKKPAKSGEVGLAAPPAPAEEIELPEIVAPAPRSSGRSTDRREPLAEDPGVPLAAEVARVDRARTAFQSKAFGRVLGELRGYEEEFPGQRLQAEVLFLRMEAHSGLGDTASAAALARRVLAAYPTSPHAARARGILAKEPGL